MPMPRLFPTASLGLVLVLSGCDKTSSGSTAPGDARVTPSTAAQVKLAHFTTADGMIGFTLDRSGTPIKLQVDGENDIVQLTQQEDRSDGGDLHGYRLVDPSNTTRVLIDKEGGIAYVRGRDELTATADAEAAPLGEPTVKGPPVAAPAAPPAYAQLASELTSISVRTKFPEFAANDSADLAKVQAAIAKSEASMFVHYVKPGPDGWVARTQTVPQQFEGLSYGGGDFATDGDDAARFEKAMKHGILLIGVSSPERDQGNHILMRRADKHDELADKTPGVVWEVDGSRAVFVTLDGGRYSVNLNSRDAPAPIARGAGAPTEWPAPLQDTYADVTVVSGLVKAGAHPQATLDELVAIDGEWNKCVAKGWKPKRIARNVNFPAAAVKIHRGCRRAMTKLETALVRFTDARTKARRALYDAAVARVKATSAK